VVEARISGNALAKQASILSAYPGLDKGDHSRGAGGGSATTFSVCAY
jgi:hypothetical protein